MENSLVSVIVPCYNQGEYLAEALESVLVQTYCNWECIVVDDGSTDNSKEVALSFCNKDKRFKYIWQENHGPSVARNNAIANSQGRYILPLDGDDKIHKDYIYYAATLLNKREDVKIVYCRAELFGLGTGEWELLDFNIDKFLLSNNIFCSAMFRRSDYNQTNGYNQNMKEGLEDWDFWLSILERGGTVYKIPYVFFYYRIKEKSRNINSMKRDVRENLYATIVRNHPLLYRKQYKLLFDELYYLKLSKFYKMFCWLRRKEIRWINIKVYMYNFFYREK